MKTLWKEALHAWLTEPRRLRLSDLPDHIRRDVGIGPDVHATAGASRVDPSDARSAVPARAVLGLQ